MPSTSYKGEGFLEWGHRKVAKAKFIIEERNEFPKLPCYCCHVTYIEKQINRKSSLVIDKGTRCLNQSIKIAGFRA